MARIIVHIITMTKQDTSASSVAAPQGDGAPAIVVTPATIEAGPAANSFRQGETVIAKGLPFGEELLILAVFSQPQ
jgi:hypothetical protein